MLRRAIASAVLLAPCRCRIACRLAAAAPTVTFKAKAVPIPGFRGTGNILGAGAALQVQYTINGSEYGGFPPPLIGVNFYTPAGTRIDPHGFTTCAPARAAEHGSGRLSAPLARDALRHGARRRQLRLPNASRSAPRSRRSSRPAARCSSTPPAARRCRSNSSRRATSTRAHAAVRAGVRHDACR